MDGRDERQVEKSRNWTGTESLFNPIHRELSAEFGVDVAGESERNERIATKPRRPLLDQMRMH
ncbi:hypothetical protein PIB30_066476 [Stylosanthes scabra]|uniref:Uncharacterized protein n=1 Tax=Stylosanthes scabra TaxID=79078 RepID=A0ABU6YNM9_9FABA|nr:hypothetical protein [Stylosanthes scabra]